MITRRNRIAMVALMVTSLAVCTSGQIAQKKKTPVGPRALALLEWTSQGLRLVPMSLVMDGKFYDAGLYRANPVPMALDEGTVYEVRRSGEAIGDFTVTQPTQIVGGVWIGQGKWVSNEERRRQAEERAKPRTGKAKSAEDEDEGPPVLRKNSQSKQPEKAPAQVQQAPAPAQPAPLEDNEPERPLLKRGVPEERPAASKPEETETKQAPAKIPEGLTQIQVAISDATKDESRPYAWKWSDEEEERKMRAAVEKLALAAVNDYAAKRGGPKPGKLEEAEIRAFDLDYNNSPDMILSARVLPAPEATTRKSSKTAAQESSTAPSNSFEYYVTVVGREDIYGNLQKTFGAVTDSKHLDAYPRMQLIDAVDADGNGGGDLLFRRISDISSSFVIYRAYSFKLEELIRVPEPKL